MLYERLPRPPEFLSERNHQDTDEIDLGRLLSTLWQGKLIVLLAMVLSVACGAIYAFRMAEPTYRATTSIVFEPQVQSILNLESVVAGFSGESSEINTEIHVFKARELLGQVVDHLNLTSDPEFNPALRDPGAVSNLKALVFGASPEPALSPEVQAMAARNGAISALSARLSVSNLRNSLIFHVTVETNNPRKSALIADTVSEFYIANQLAVKFETMEQATRSLSALVATEQAALARAEAARAAYSASTDLISQEGLFALELQLKEARERLEVATAEIGRLQTQSTALDAATGYDERVKLTNDPVLSGIYAEQSPGWQARFDDRYATIKQELATTLERHEQQYSLLNVSLLDLSARIERQNQDFIQLQQLTREVSAKRTTYEHLLRRFNDVAVQEGIQKSDSRILSQAQVPGAPSSPQKRMILAVSLILGALSGSAIVLAREAMNNGFRSARELEKATGLQVLGHIPRVPKGDRRGVLQYLHNNPQSSAAEAVRDLRTSILLTGSRDAPRVIGITSALPKEGKTTTAIALAHNLVGLDKSVLLIEGDLRRRSLAEYYKDLPADGVETAIFGDKKISDAIYHDETTGVDILPGQSSTANAADIFSSPQFRDLVKKMRSRYDFVIIDTPPVLMVPDARIIRGSVDCMVFVVNWNNTKEEQVQDGLRQFYRARHEISGLVLSKISPKHMKRYGYGYGYYMDSRKMVHF